MENKKVIFMRYANPYGKYFDIDSPEGEFRLLFEQTNIVEEMQKDMLKKGQGR